VHLQAGPAFSRYCEASAKYTIGDAIGDPVADEILYALRQAGPDGMVRREISDLFSRNRSSDTITNALLFLFRYGKAQRRMKPNSSGRAYELWTATQHHTN